MHHHPLPTILFLVLSSASPLFAADEKPFDPVEYKASCARTVDTCVKEVQKELPYSRFDAYVSGNFNVKMIGTEESHFKFNKCMSQRGHPLGPPNRPDSKSR